MALKSRISSELHRRIFELTLALYRVTDFFPQQEALRLSLREKANEVFGSIIEYGYDNPVSREDVVVIIARLQSMNGYLGLARSLRFVKPINIMVLEREYNTVIGFFESELAPLEIEREPTESTNLYKKMGFPGYEGGTPMESVRSRFLTGLAGDHYIHDVQKSLGEERQEVTERLQTWEEFRQETTGELLPAAPERPPVFRNIKVSAPLHYSEGAAEDINDRQKTIMEHLKTAQQAKISDFYSIFEGISSKTIQRDLQSLVVKNILKKEGEKRWTVYSLNNVL